MAVGKSEKGAEEEEKVEAVAMAERKGEKGSVAAGKGEKGPTVADKGKGVPEEAGKEVADGGMITLKSSEGKPFEVSKEVAARLSKFLADEIARGCSDGGIELEKIGSEALEKVVDYCNKHDPCAAAGSSRSSSRTFYTAPSKELEEWDRKLVDRLSQNALFDLVEAADFLKMEGLLDVTCRKVADMIKGKTTAQIREIFNIENDFTKEQEEEIRRENAWAFNDDD